MVNFEATVVRFKPNAMHDRFPGGGFASYDASELRVESPPERRGQTLLIHHHPSPPESSLWRQTGRKLRFGIREEDLSGLQVLFNGAVEGLQDAS